jgi:hypothetical protein
MNKPARRVVTPSKGRVVGRMYSCKSQKLVPWESQLERDAMLLLDLTPEVVGYESQPMWLLYSWGGKERLYYPDILLETAHGEKVVEIKPADKLLEHGVLSRFAAIRSVLEEKGYAFEIWTEEQIYAQPRWSNVLMLQHYRLLGGITYSLLSVAEVFAGKQRATIGKLAQRLSADGAMEAVLPYIAGGILCVDYNVPITPASEVWFFEERGEK